jgi:hypothetical protein
MGAMKDFLMWTEEKGYVEYIDMPDGGRDWINTPTHPGDSQVMSEYLEQREKFRNATKKS